MHDLWHIDHRFLLAERSKLLSEWSDELLLEASVEGTSDPVLIEQLEGLVESWTEWGDEVMELADDLAHARPQLQLFGRLRHLAKSMRPSVLGSNS